MAVKKSFKELMDELDQSVKALEESDLDIEVGLKEFEKGIKLFQQCKKRLESIEEKTQILIAENGAFFLEEIDEEN